MVTSGILTVGSIGMLRVLFSHAAPRIAFRIPTRALHNTGTKSQQPKASPGQQIPEGPEYIPRRKAKNPMTKIGWAWFIGMPTGILGFLFTKREVDKNRLKQMKIRQRMKAANEGEYSPVRYRSQQTEKESVASPPLLER